MNFIDLFAGAGGLSEGFIRAGFTPLAHVEYDQAACNTLLTRTCYYYLKKKGKLNIYYSYLKDEGISRKQLFQHLDPETKKSIINKTIGPDNKIIFDTIDKIIDGRQVDIIIGGPPCQAYSIAGRSRDKNKMVGDSRNYLYKEYAKYLRKYKPLYFVFENVTGLLSAKNKDGSYYLDSMLKSFKKAGYTTEYKILNSSDFGVLQNRKRVILIGRKGKKKGFYPEFDYWHPNVKINELFEDLPEIQAGQGTLNHVKLSEYTKDYLYKSMIRNSFKYVTHHIARPNTYQDKEIYRRVVEKWNESGKRLSYNELPDNFKTHVNRSSHLDRFKVVGGNEHVSQTIVAHIAKDGHYYIHPDIRQNRSLTPREAARIQSFPDNYYFEAIGEHSARTSAFKQIGNAVPPLLAYGIAKAMLKILNNDSQF